MKLIFMLHGIADPAVRKFDLYGPDTRPAIRLKQLAKIEHAIKECEGIVWFTGASRENLNVDAGWRFYELKKL